MEWDRGDELGRGSFATVNLAIPTVGNRRFPPLMAVKSSELSSSASLKNEKQILDQIGSSPHIITCFGDSYTIETETHTYYNLLLEYAGRGNLADNLRTHGGALPESAFRRYSRAILNGLSHIHANGFVHCDIKLENILVFDNGDAKIADFGLAKKAGKDEATKNRCRGTPLYMSPESVIHGEYEPPCDIWALGCMVAEMATGKPAWNYEPDSNIYALMLRIGVGDEVPEVPGVLSDEGRDFVRKCFVKDPRGRWTAEMLLNHPFVTDEISTLKEMELPGVSPRCPFDFPEFVSQPLSSGEPWDDMYFCSSIISEDMNSRSDFAFSSIISQEMNPPLHFGSAIERLRRLGATKSRPDWSVSDGWVTVR